MTIAKRLLDRSMPAWLPAGLLVCALVASALVVRTGHAQAAGFVAAPVFDARGTAFAVFGGGSTGDLEAAARVSGATGVWAQDASGGYVLLVVDGPAFLRTPFLAAFPDGFTGATAVTLVRAGTPAPAATPTATPAATPAPATLSAAIAQIIVQRTNEQRVANGLGALSVDPQLASAASLYADVVFAKDATFSSGVNPHELDGQLSDRVDRSGYRWASIGENIATMSNSEQQSAAAAAGVLMDGWMDSPGHRANILKPGFTETGVGCATGRAAGASLDFTVVCVAVFGTPR